MESPLLDVRDMCVYFRSVRGTYQVVDGVSFAMRKGEILGIAGESGCGKSTLVDGILRLVRPPGYIASGQVIAEEIATGLGQSDLLRLSAEEFRRLRWKAISYIPQGSMNSLNPIMKIKEQITNAILAHDPQTKKEVQARIPELLSTVGLPTEVADMYPHELSGGMKQRAIIAMAIALKPLLIVADEPTTALDVTIQRVIIQTLARIRELAGSALLVVSHDMSVHAQLSDRLVIMYAGKVVEIGDVRQIFDHPQHPYTQGLIATIPAITNERKRMYGIPGTAPSPLGWPGGCRFHPRCPYAEEVCSRLDPAMEELAAGQYVACHTYQRQKGAASGRNATA